jgi:hypothetical protein
MTRRKDRRQGIPETWTPDLIEVLGRGIRDVFTPDPTYERIGPTLQKERDAKAAADEEE